VRTLTVTNQNIFRIREDGVRDYPLIDSFGCIHARIPVTRDLYNRGGERTRYDLRGTRHRERNSTSDLLDRISAVTYHIRIDSID